MFCLERVAVIGCSDVPQGKEVQVLTFERITSTDIRVTPINLKAFADFRFLSKPFLK